MTGPSMIEVHGQPAAPLRRYVTSYVGFQVSGFPAGVHLGPPSGALIAVISLAEPLDVASLPGVAVGNGGRFASVSSGLTTRSLAIHHHGRQHGIKLALTPVGARAVYRMPAAALAETVVPLEELLGPIGSELLDRLRASADWPSRFATLDELLVRAVGRGAGGEEAAHEARPEVVEMWRRLVVARGQVQVAALADDLGWSRRHLAERFRTELGLTPKTVARILRFEHAHRLASAARPPSWTEVSARAGYADQAHLVRDWRSFTGRTPTEWRRGETLVDAPDH